MLDNCGECKWKYPTEILSAMFVNGGYTPPICGICALEIVNKVHGTKVKRFTGEMAEFNRQSALEWRKKHPTWTPK